MVLLTSTRFVECDESFLSGVVYSELWFFLELRFLFAALNHFEYMVLVDAIGSFQLVDINSYQRIFYCRQRFVRCHKSFINPGFNSSRRFINEIDW